MHIIGYWFALSLIFGALTASAVEPNDDCGAKLVAADRYFGTLSARVRAGEISLDALRKIAESDQPANPIKFETPGSRNSSAIRLFEALINDADVRANWALTRERIRKLLEERGVEVARRDRAEEQTAKILLPRAYFSLQNFSDKTSLTVLPDQRAVVAAIQPPRINVFDLATKKEIESITLPAHFTAYALEWP